MARYGKVFTILIAFIILILLFLSFFYDNWNETFAAPPLSDLSGFKLTTTEDPKQYRVDMILPEAFLEAQTIFFRSNNIKFIVYLDNQAMYSFGYDEQIPFIKSPALPIIH